MLADNDYPIVRYQSWQERIIRQERGYSIGAEVLAQVTAFSEGYLANMVIFDLQIINTTSWDYHDAYIGLFYGSDNPWYWLTNQRPAYPGLKTKYIKNEYEVGKSTGIPYNLSYNYNSKFAPGIDSTYFGVQFLKTPLAQSDGIDNNADGKIDEPEGEELGLTGWHFFRFDDILWRFGKMEQLQYQVLSGDTTDFGWMVDSTCFFADSLGYLDPNFDFSERITDSWLYTGWFYRGLGRGRVWLVYNLMSCGPINWASGDTLNFVFAILAAEDFNRLKKSAQMARIIAQNDYSIRQGPPPPKVTAVPGNGKVTLYWDRSAETAGHYLTGYQNFEGYKIYRTTTDPSDNNWGEPNYDDDGNLINFLPIARCDWENGIKGYEHLYPFEKYGDDTGLFHTWTDTTVTSGVTYWYSVCSYDHGIIQDLALNPDRLPASPLKECPKGTDPERDANLVKVIPGIQASDFQAPIAQVEQFSDAAGNGTIEPLIIDPYQVKGHNYLVSFEDTTYGFAVYDLYDEAENKLLLEKVTSTSGEEGVIFDGIQLFVKRYDDMEVLNERTFWYKYDTKEPSNCTWSIHGGKLTWDPYPFEYDIRFTEKMDTSVFTKKTAPFEIWNTILNRKSLWDIYWNFAGTDTTDSLKNTWSSGDIIYIWDEFNEKNKFTLRIIISEKSVYTYQGLMNIAPQPGDVAHIALKRPFITGDRFRIKTSSMKKQEIDQAGLNKIKVVPNPYIVQAGWELGMNESKIQFINLPAECKIHIFTMAGDKVRTLEHNNPNTNYEFWNLLNISNLKVSYGLYIYVVETPDGKSASGKFVILK